MTGDLLLHSVSYAGLWGQASLTLEKFVDRAASLGYDGVMLMAKRPHLSVLDYEAMERGRLRARIEKAGLRSVCIAGYTNFTADLEHGDIPHREIQIHYVTELARLAADLGGSTVRIFTGYENPAQPYSAQWTLVVNTLREAAKRASAFNVTLGIQNHHDIAASSEALAALIHAVGEPNCRAMFDAWAPALHGDDLSEAGRKLGAITVHTTAADYVKHRRFRYDPGIVNYTEQTPTVQAVPMGEGFIDYRGFFRGMHDSGFQGSIAYEMCSPLRDGNTEAVLDNYARRFVEFMRELRAEDSGEPRTSSPPRMATV